MNLPGSARGLAFLALLVLPVGGMRAGDAEAAFDLAALGRRARELATRPYAPPAGQVPEWLRQLTYDDLRRIEFDGRESLWRRENLPFQVQFLHPGFLFDRTVRLHELWRGVARPIPFRRDYFQYRNLRTGPVPGDLGFAGFRLMYPFGGVGTPHLEAGSFAGASYFRFLGSDAVYGLSARGLAVNTAEPGPEEFPAFTEFWLERGAPGATEMTVYALLDGESVTGAYRFVITPGRTTVLHVRAMIYCRRNPAVLGLAPLTSMFWHGENSTVPRDFRPEVHDSDGLLLHTGAGEWIWRPLVNPARLRVAAMADENPRIFGLLQRDRNFENYQDLEAAYHLRPAAWVEPVGNWGRGAVRLVEIPTATEFDDNIVAFWVPEKLPPPGTAIELEYRIHWSLDALAPPGAFVRATRHGKSAAYEPGLERFVVDFDGPALQALPSGTKLEPVVTVGAPAVLHHATLEKNRFNGTWRLAFTVRPDGSGRPVELRCFVRRGGEALSETWSYLWEP